MFVRFWGVRGSIPVSGKECVRYGGDSSCLEIRTGTGEVVIVDAGTGIRSLGSLLIEEGVTHVNLLFSHFHLDHIIGLPFFKPLYQQDVTINVIGCPSSQGSFENIYSQLMHPPYFPVPFERVSSTVHYEMQCNETFAIGDTTVTTIPLSHTDPGFGYRFSAGSSSFVFLTDNELGHAHDGGRSFEEYVRFCRGADLLVHDAEYTSEDYASKKGWGHSTYHDALRLALAAGVKRFGLFHHNQERTDDGLDAIVSECRAVIANAGSPLECFAVAQGMEFELDA